MLEVNDRDSWYQQSDATCHASDEIMDMLGEYFGYKLTLKILWTSRSPELSITDFFVRRGHLSN